VWLSFEPGLQENCGSYFVDYFSARLGVHLSLHHRRVCGGGGESLVEQFHRDWQHKLQHFDFAHDELRGLTQIAVEADGKADHNPHRLALVDNQPANCRVVCGLITATLKHLKR
jgi:hypothetical protein